MNINYLDPNALLWLAAAFLALYLDWGPALYAWIVKVTKTEIPLLAIILLVWYNDFSEGQKRLVMAFFLILAAVLVFVGSCLQLDGLTLACSALGAKSLVIPLIFAIAINQGTHFLTKPVK